MKKMYHKDQIRVRGRIEVGHEKFLVREGDSFTKQFVGYDWSELCEGLELCESGVQIDKFSMKRSRMWDPPGTANR